MFIFASNKHILLHVLPVPETLYDTNLRHYLNQSINF